MAPTRSPFGSLLQGEIAVVTGAAQGNGAAIATGLAESGAAVALLDLDASGAEQVASSIRDMGGHAVAAHVDVTNPEACHQAADFVQRELGVASVLVNNAGVIQRVGMLDPHFVESVEFTYRVNVLGTLQMTQALLPQLIESHGRIVNLGSIASFLATPGGAGYAASKGAVLQVTKTLAADLAVHGIRVNGVAPGVITTPMTEATRRSPEIAARFLGHTPMGRFGDPAEVVGPVIFLASQMSAYVTGVMLPVDGGYLTV